VRSLLPAKYHLSIYYFALALLVASLPLSVFMMSLAQLILLGNWILGGQIPTKLQLFWNNKTAVVLSSLVLLHMLGLLYSSDLSYGFEDIRKKAPLLLLPLILSSSPRLTEKQFNWLMCFFIAAIAAGTLISMGVLLEFIHSRKAKLPITDVRQISIFISHIRFSLLICVAIFILGYYFVVKRSVVLKILTIVLIGWFLLFMVILESLTGLLAVFIISTVLLLYQVLKKQNWTKKITGLGLVLITIGVCFWYINHLVEQYYVKPVINTATLAQRTSLGNNYVHDTLSTETENGNYTSLYLCQQELRDSWNKRSLLLYDSTDRKGNELKYTLIRFLTSLNYRKDADGVNSLSTAEIAAIENGVANADYLGRINLKGRINQIIWEIDNYRRGMNPSGHSLSQRFEYWKAAISIVKQHPILGVGTGDVKTAFSDSYQSMNSSLDKRWRLRSHNQFLAITVGLGIVGLFWFLITLLYPLFKEKKMLNYFYIVFFLTVFISFFSEDTLETQPGVTFYAFFNCLLLFLMPVRSNDTEG